MVEIKNRLTGEVICRGETWRQACEANKAALRSADLRYADLRYAVLRSADLRYADLSYAVLRSADLHNAIISWESHDICFELLRRAAGDNVAKRKAAGLVIASRDWCWDEFADLDEDPGFVWAITELAKYVKEGDKAPEVLLEAALRLKLEATT